MLNRSVTGAAWLGGAAAAGVFTGVAAATAAGLVGSTKAGFVASVGTGGTLAGTSMFLKKQNPEIKAVCADPYGAAMYSWFKNGDLKTKDGDSVAEGIGQTRVTENLKGILIDEAYRITDQMALGIVYQLMREEGIFVGLSSGINAAGALRLAREGGPGQVIVTLLCDSGIRYMTRLFNSEWLLAHGLDPDLPVS